MRKLLLALAVLLCAPLAANAATCYWVAGTSYNAATSWSSATGGTPSTCTATGGVPKNAGDIAFLDTNSPAATTLLVDVDITSMATIDMRNLTGGSGLDFTTHSVTFTTSFLATGTGTRSLSLGSGTLTVGNGGVWNNLTTTGETFNGGTGTIVLAIGSTNIQFFSGGKTYPNLTIAGSNAGGIVGLEQGNNASFTVTNFSVTGGAIVNFTTGQTLTVTNGFNIVGTAAAPVYYQIASNSNNPQTILAVGAASTCQWCIFRGVVGSTNAITATNSLSLGSVGGTISITNPGTGGGGGGYIIGGQ